MRTLPGLHARRQVLRGTGGFVLGLPFLPSLVERGAAAQTVAPRKRFFAITTEHGAVTNANMLPAESMLTAQTDIYTGHTVRSGVLSVTASGANSVLSPALTAPTSKLTSKLVSKLNVLRGLDHQFNSGHQQGCHLGNFAAVVAGNTMEAWPTIDQALAWSPTFYKNLNGIKSRSVVTGQGNVMSWGYSNPQQQTGAIQQVNNETSSRALFTKLIGAGTTTPPPMARKPIVDRILQNYRELRTGNRRLSVADRQRLDDHISRLSELERQINDSIIPIVSCNHTQPTGEANTLLNTDPRDIDGVAYFRQINDIIAMAFACDTTRVVVAPVVAVMTPYTGSWHQDIAHQNLLPESQRLLTAGAQGTFEHIFLDLAAKLDTIEETPGRSVLDNTLMMWSQESGPEPHGGQELPIITFGGAGGALKTGLYVDYRNKTASAQFAAGRYMGLGYRRFLSTALQAMGVPRTEYERNGVPGYGDGSVRDGWDKYLRPQAQTAIGDMLPIIAV